jgi:glycosyltransferase involved in cell wall biosynthesis
MQEPTVTIAVLTYRRPDELARILPLLVEQTTTITPAASVLVVDNDTAASAREQVGAWRGHGVRYVHEPKPGIAAARNRAIAEVGDRADAVVFIDDDETPSSNWLRELVEQWRADGSAAVAGPVRRVFETEPDPWVIGSEVFVRRTYRTGEQLEWAATSNLLLDVSQIRSYGVEFDDRYGITGGSDSLYTKTLVKRGGVITWCDAAEVLDPVPAARATRRWVKLRTFRFGNGWTRMGIDLRSSFWGKLYVRADAHKLATYMVLRGSLFWLRGVFTSNPQHRGYGACRLTGALGVISGAYGYVYSEYRRHHDRKSAP